MKTVNADADFESLAALPELSRFSAILTKLTGVPMSLHSPVSDLHITYGGEIKNPLCRIIRSTEIGAKRCTVCDSGHSRMSAARQRPLLYKCHSGFFDMIIPLFVRGAHVANILSGQILAEPPSEEGFAKIKKRLVWLSSDDTTLRKAYFSALYLPKEKVKQIMGLLEIFAVQLCESLRRIRELESHLERAELRKAKEYVTGHFSDPNLGLAETAAYAGLSPAHFSHVFKQCTGTPFTRYVQSVRLGEAKRLLSRTDQSISEICFACGFNSLANFIRVFRALEQTTPSLFKASLR
jgi:AraC-like DNA-binding protein/ligand-binding sensor protein